MVRRVAIVCLLALSGASPAAERLTYAGSSTIGKFVTEAAFAYNDARFNVSTLGESAYGEQCVETGRCDIGGVAREPDRQGMAAGVNAILIGWDMISVITHKDNPLGGLSLDQLQRVFSGEVKNWSQLGGADLKLTPYMVRQASATYQVFREEVMRGAAFSGVTTVSFDAKMAAMVAGDKGGIGIISSAFIARNQAVKVLEVSQEIPGQTLDFYPISRPLYLLLPADPKPAAKAFVEWVLGPEGQAILQKQFIGMAP